MRVVYRTRIVFYAGDHYRQVAKIFRRAFAGTATVEARSPGDVALVFERPASHYKSGPAALAWAADKLVTDWPSIDWRPTSTKASTKLVEVSDA